MFLLSPLPRHFCLCLILRFLLPLFLLSSLRVLSTDFSLLPSSSLTWPVSSAPGWGSPPLASVFPCYLRCSAWHSIIVCCLCLLCSYWLLCRSKALPLRCLGLLGLFGSMQFAPSRSRVFSGLFSSSFLRCSSCLRCGSLWLCLSAVQALLGFFFPCSLLLGFSAASSLPPFVLLLLPPLRVSLFSPQLRLALSLLSLVLLLCLAVLRLMLRCLGLLRLLPSSSLCLVRVLLSFSRGLWLGPMPVLWLRFLRLLFLPFACLRLRWCLPYW